MAEHVIIGIDIGGSTTKIVGFDCSTPEKTLIRPQFVRATDPITSIYGAFGKFLDQNSLTLGDVRKVMFTGAGSSYMSKPIYGLPSEKIAEFKSIGLGGLYLSHLDRAIIASCGTGTALVYAEEGAEPDYLGGTGVGGGTLVGLSKKMLGMDNVEHIAELAKGGSLDRVDLKIKDITKSDIVPGFSDIMTASNFGQLSDLATREDIALGIINMVFETIGMVAIFAARNYKIRDVVLTGNLSQVPQAETVFATLNRMFDMNFIIPESSAFGTVIGAALAGMNA
ncbi:MAG: type II pantothenate kinase [Clostridia bacterium]|jgi:type II pantothenate kinase|nr:type II pantothenate kinase [Clostridia bacterium]MBQ4351889.1 type II pantothenate kinase [Clostridia bacterium]